MNKTLKTLLLLAWVTPLTATWAQEINFSDLKREGSPVVKRYAVAGVANDGRSYLQHFDGVDRARVQSYQAAAAQAAANRAAESRNSASSSSKSSPPAKAMKTFSCYVYCNSGGGPTTSRDVQAASRSEAAKLMGDSADQICQNSGYRRASSISFPESQCRER